MNLFIFTVLSFCFIAHTLKASVDYPDMFFLIYRGRQRDFRRDVKNGENVLCWFIHNNGSGLIDGEAKDYIVSSLFKTV